MIARLDLRLDAVDAFGAEFMLDAKATGRRSGTTLKLDPTQNKVAGNVLGDLNAQLERSDLHHAELTLFADVEEELSTVTWTRTVTLELGRKITLKLPDFLGDTAAAAVVEATNEVNLDGTPKSAIQLSATDPNETGSLSFSTENLPSWGTLNDNGDGTGSISFDPSEEDDGSYEFTVFTDDSFATTSATFTVNVKDGVASLQGDEFTGSHSADAASPEGVATKASGGGVETQESKDERTKDKEEDKEENKEEDTEKDEDENPDFNNLSVKKLNELIAKYELSDEGKKSDKVSRLEDHYSNASEEDQNNMRNDYKEL